MKKIFIFIVVILLFISHAFAKEPTAGQGISHLVPTAEDLPQWRTSGEPRHVIGDDLYELINGGAEIYHEYGFKQAISQKYENNNQKSFNLEIYEMQNAAAAYGAYTFKTSTQGKKIPVGTEGFFEEYFLNFWKGPYVVTLIGFDSEQETLDVILLAAQKVDEKIKTENAKPEMINLLPEVLEDQLKSNGIKYLKGNLAVFNSYEFDSDNIFGLKEGVMGEYRDFNLFIFKYANSNECQKWFNNFIAQNNTFSVIDSNNKYIHVESINQYIFIVIGTEKLANNIMKQIRSDI